MPARGTKQIPRAGICNAEGAPLYKVVKYGLPFVKMYLCNKHAQTMKNHSFTLTLIPESDIIKA